MSSDKQRAEVHSLTPSPVHQQQTGISHQASPQNTPSHHEVAQDSSKQNGPYVQHQHNSTVQIISNQVEQSSGSQAHQHSEQKGVNHINQQNLKPIQSHQRTLKTDQSQQPVENPTKSTPQHIPLKAQTKHCAKFIDEQMHNDLKKLENSLKKQPKQKHKNRMNKTMINTPIYKEQSDGQQFRKQQQIMFHQMTLHKKRENCQRLKQWDKRRQKSLALHRNLVETLHCEIDKRIKASIQNLEKSRQQQQYATYPITNTRNALKNNSLSKNIYINCSVILNTLSEEHNQRCAKILDFVQLIQNDILQNLISQHQIQSQRKLLRVREKISNLKKSLRKYDIETEEKSNQLSIFFNGKTSHHDHTDNRDLYAVQLEFLHKANKQTTVQKKLGEYCLEYYQIAIEQELTRSKVIRQAIVTFTQGLKQCYNYENDPAEIEQLCKDEQQKLIKEFYTLQELFDERHQQVLRTDLNLSGEEQLALSHYKEYLDQFEFEDFDCRVALVKQFNVKYMVTSKHESNMAKTYENCYMVITADCFLHLFLSKQKTDSYASPDVSLNLATGNLDFRPDKSPQMLQIVVKSERRKSMIGYFLDKKKDKVHCICFPKQDARQQFLGFVKNKA